MVERNEPCSCAIFGLKLQPFAFGAEPLGDVVHIGHHHALLFAQEHHRIVDCCDAMRLVNRISECSAAEFAITIMPLS